MPWKECHVMDERLRFVARLLEGEKMAPLCAESGISRKTGYKIFTRYKDCGLEAFTDRSRRPTSAGEPRRRPPAARYAVGGHETGAFAIGDELLAALDERCGGWCLAARGCYSSQCQTTCQRGDALEEFPTIRSLRTHRSLLLSRDRE
jgi:hypothetical protein